MFQSLSQRDSECFSRFTEESSSIKLNSRKLCMLGEGIEFNKKERREFESFVDYQDLVKTHSQ